MISNAILIGTDHSTSLTADFEGIDGMGSSNSSSTGTGKISPMEILVSGKLDNGKTMIWNDPTTGKKIGIPITGQTVLTDSGKPIGPSTLNQVQQTEIAQVLDVANVTFGGKSINP